MLPTIEGDWLSNADARAKLAVGNAGGTTTLREFGADCRRNSYARRGQRRIGSMALLDPPLTPSFYRRATQPHLAGCSVVNPQRTHHRKLGWRRLRQAQPLRRDQPRASTQFIAAL